MPNPITILEKKPQLEALKALHENFDGYLRFIAERTYLQPLPLNEGNPLHKNPPYNNLENRLFSELLLKHSEKLDLSKPSDRGVHGVMHTTRATTYTKILHNLKQTLLNANGTTDPFAIKATEFLAKKFSMTEEDIIMLTQIATFFHDSAREGENVDYWDHRSAENCFEFLSKLGIDERAARFFAIAARYKTDFNHQKDTEEKNAFEAECLKLGFTQEYLSFCHYPRDLIGFADMLDVMRIRLDFNGDKIDEFLNGTLSPANRQKANSLMSEVLNVIEAQGDLQFEMCTAHNQNTEVATKIQNVDDEHPSKNSDFEQSKTPYALMDADIQQASPFLKQHIDGESQRETIDAAEAKAVQPVVIPQSLTNTAQVTLVSGSLTEPMKPVANNWVVVSMVNSIASLESVLNNFPTPTKSRYERHFVSGTLIVSGEKQNTPMRLYREMAFGYTIDPEKVNLLFAAKEDFYSGESEGVSLSLLKTNVELMPKKGALLYDENFLSFFEYTEHMEKKGLISNIIIGEKSDKLTDKFFTNISQWDREKKEWTAIPTFDLVAANILRQYHKNPTIFLNYNEILMNQKGPDNPINGIIISANNVEDISSDDIKKLIKIFQKNNAFELSIYDPQQLPEPIVRRIGNSEAIQLLEGLLSNTIVLNKEFIQSLPSISQQKSLEEGFDFKSLESTNTATSKKLQKLEEDFSTSATSINELEQKELSEIRELQSASMKKAINQVETRERLQTLEKEFSEGNTAINALEQKELSEIRELQSASIKKAINPAETPKALKVLAENQSNNLGRSLVTLISKIKQQRPVNRDFWFRRKNG